MELEQERLKTKAKDAKDDDDVEDDDAEAKRTQLHYIDGEKYTEEDLKETISGDDDEEDEDEDEDEEEEEEDHEYEINDRVLAFASFANGDYLPARVIHEEAVKSKNAQNNDDDLRKKKDAAEINTKKQVIVKRYYCSYEGYSNRMDAWLDCAKMRPLKEEDDGSNEHDFEDEEEQEDGAVLKKKKKKRSIDDDSDVGADEEEAGDAAAAAADDVQVLAASVKKRKKAKSSNNNTTVVLNSNNNNNTNAVSNNTSNKEGSESHPRENTDINNNNTNDGGGGGTTATTTTTTINNNNNNSNNEKKKPKGKPKGEKLKKDTHDAVAAIVKNAKNVDVLQLGAFEVDCWYRAPYPDYFTSDNRLYVCEFCLKYCKKRKTLVRHKKCCPIAHPPGNEIYRHPAETIVVKKVESEGGEEVEVTEIVRPQLSVFEVDGVRAPTYCQNLCLLAKLFLDHKTLYHDVSQMLFYALTEKGEDNKQRVVGYFSKDKNGSQTGHNLACILTLPPYQRKGYGRFLIAFSYELTKRENWIGTPEKPLSDLGLMSYSTYWGDVISELLKSLEIGTVISVSKISKLTHVATQDVVLVLEQAQILKPISAIVVVGGGGVANKNNNNDQQEQEEHAAAAAAATKARTTKADVANMVIEVTDETIAKLDEIVTPATRRANALDVNVEYLRWEGTPQAI